VIKKIFLIHFLFLNFGWAQDLVVDPNATAQVVEENIEVQIGIDRIQSVNFEFPQGGVSLGSDILSVKVDRARKELTLKGIKQGETSLTIRDSSGEIKKTYIVRVTATGKSKIVSEIRELIGDVEGLEIGIKGDKVYVGGEIVVPSDIGRVSIVLDTYPEVLRLVELSPQTQRVIARKMMDELFKNGLKEVTVRIVNKTFWIEGVVSSKAKETLALDIVKAYLPDKLESLAFGKDRVASAQRSSIISFLAINEKKDPPPAPKLVKITSQFVELTKDYSRLFGFKWAPLMGESSGSISFGQSQETGGVSARGNNTLAATISNLFPKLNSVKNAGYARIVQSGMVVVKDTVRGTISKNQRIPFAIGTGDFTRASEATITFNMGVTPTILEEEKVDMNLTIDVTLPTGTGANSVPVTTTNNIATNVVVKSKESAVIGGIVQTSSTTAYDKDDPAPPANQQAAPLFRLIRSKNYRTSKSQYVIFVTPELIESASAGTEEIRKKFRRRSQ
jgi:pilus assembly protein CpaC